MIKNTKQLSKWVIEEPSEFRFLYKEVDPDVVGKTIGLVHLDDAHLIQPGDILYSIHGERVIAREDKIDMDTRFGYIAFGYVLD